MIYCRIQPKDRAERFSTDVAEVIRLFFPLAEICFCEQTPVLEADDCLISCSFGAETAKALYKCYGEEATEVEEKLEAGESSLEQKRFDKWLIKRLVFVAMQTIEKRDFPWGCLTGVRPGKLARELSQRFGGKKARELFSNKFFVHEAKIDLCMDIVKRQEIILQSSRKSDFDLYIGIPFCRTRCLYCSFAAYELGTSLAKESDVEAYLAALNLEISENLRIAKEYGYTLRSIYIGGGTPTALSAAQLHSLLGACEKNLHYKPLEWTVEAGRPDSIDEEKLAVMQNFGVNRISINPQTMHDQTLKQIGRAHTQSEFLKAYDLARKINFDCINMDLIVGLPGENVAMMRETMQAVKRLAPENLTIHTLAIKRSADLKRRLQNISLPDAAEAQKMLDIAQAKALEMALLPYYLYRQKYMSGSLENVGYALPGTESLYNIDIMEEQNNILALGAGAISKWVYPEENRLEREANPKDISSYIKKCSEMTKRRAALMEQGSFLC